MEKELGPDVIKATQTSLGKYVKRPPLSEKLLKKPPFRFLHDIVTSVLKTNGFFKGLFEENELISDNVKDRDSKISFLNKVITVIALTTGNNLSVKPSKIVAGQEPEKTNELLQNLAHALDKKMTSDEAVKKYKENVKTSQAPEGKTKENESKQVKNNNDAKKSISKSNEKLTSNKKEPAPVNKNEKSKANDLKSKKKETSVSKTESKPKKIQSFKAVGKKASATSITQPSNNDTKTDDTLNQAHSEQNPTISNKEIKENEEDKLVDAGIRKSTLQVQENDAESNGQINALTVDQELQGKLNISYTIAENELNSSLSSLDLMDVRNDNMDDKKCIENPVVESNENISEAQINGTYNKEIPSKIKEQPDETESLKNPKPVLIPKHKSFDSEIKAKELIRNNSHDNIVNHANRQAEEVVRPSSVRPPSGRPPSARPPSSRPGAPRLREKTDNVIPENDNLLLGKVNIIAENAQNEEEEDNSVIVVDQQGSSTLLEDQQEALQLSLNEHGHLVQQILNSQKELSQVTGKTEIEWQFGAQKAKEASSREIEQLRFNIQALSRVANPLGKLLDHIQEDVEVMRQELQQWTNVYEEVSKDMLKQKTANEETLVPLHTRVKQLDVDIEEKRDKINDIKILIHKNTARIEKLLVNGNMQ